MIYYCYYIINEESSLEMEPDIVLDRYVSPIFIALGIFGNAFMLSILFHLHRNFYAKAKQNNSDLRETNPRRFSIPSCTMCIFMTFLSIADLGYHVTWMHISLDIMMTRVFNNAFKGIIELIYKKIVI